MDDLNNGPQSEANSLHDRMVDPIVAVLEGSPKRLPYSVTTTTTTCTSRVHARVYTAEDDDVDKYDVKEYDVDEYDVKEYDVDDYDVNNNNVTSPRHRSLLLETAEDIGEDWIDDENYDGYYRSQHLSKNGEVGNPDSPQLATLERDSQYIIVLDDNKDNTLNNEGNELFIGSDDVDTTQPRYFVIVDDVGDNIGEGSNCEGGSDTSSIGRYFEVVDGVGSEGACGSGCFILKDGSSDVDVDEYVDEDIDDGDDDDDYVVVFNDKVARKVVALKDTSMDDLEIGGQQFEMCPLGELKTDSENEKFSDREHSHNVDGKEKSGGRGRARPVRRMETNEMWQHESMVTHAGKPMVYCWFSRQHLIYGSVKPPPGGSIEMEEDEVDEVAEVKVDKAESFKSRSVRLYRKMKVCICTRMKFTGPNRKE